MKILSIKNFIPTQSFKLMMYFSILSTYTVKYLGFFPPNTYIFWLLTHKAELCYLG